VTPPPLSDTRYAQLFVVLKEYSFANDAKGSIQYSQDEKKSFHAESSLISDPIEERDTGFELSPLWFPKLIGISQFMSINADKTIERFKFVANVKKDRSSSTSTLRKGDGLLTPCTTEEELESTYAVTVTEIELAPVAARARKLSLASDDE